MPELQKNGVQRQNNTFKNTANFSAFIVHLLQKKDWIRSQMSCCCEMDGALLFIQVGQ